MGSFTGPHSSKNGDGAISRRRRERRIRYGDRRFAAASALQGNRVAANRARRALSGVAAAFRRPQRVAALLVVVFRTPPVYLLVSESLAGQALRAYFNQRVLGLIPKNRLCQGVLTLPDHRSEYLRGRRRHALRTNLRKAAAAGITCEVLDDDSLAVDAVEAITRSSRKGPLATADVNYFRSLLANPGMTLLVARDTDGFPRAVTAAVIDEMVCLTEWSTSNSHEARWALHDHLVDFLITRGVRYLISSGEGPFGALGFTTNVQHYQHLLGYELRHVMQARPVRETRRRRLAAALAVVACTVVAIAPRAAADAGPAAPVFRMIPQGGSQVFSNRLTSCVGPGGGAQKPSGNQRPY